MTEPKGIYWQRQKGAYRQPNVVEPEQNQNANNARHSIWHLGHEFKIEVFPESEWRVGDDDARDDLRHDRGEPVRIPVRGSIQPYHGEKSGSSDIIEAPGGSILSGMVIAHIDSHEPFNIDSAVKANSGRAKPLFPSGGIEIVSDEDTDLNQIKAHPTVLIWKGRSWKVMSVIELYEGGDEELAAEGRVFRCMASRMENTSQERDATPAVAESAGETSFWGGTDP